MHVIDYALFVAYLALVVAIGVYFYNRNENVDDYYVGGRDIGPVHVGFSVVATDVGGGFSIGLGGLGFAMGLAGSWMLFTGLLGAILAATFVVPRIKRLDELHGFLTYPDFLRHRFGRHVALVAALISGLGYLGFTGGQILAGAKLASETIVTWTMPGLTPLQTSLALIAAVTVTYTVLGGLKAVIYTDSLQWAILLCGLIIFTLPAALHAVGGWQGLHDKLPAAHFSLTAVPAATLVNWMVTIIPIWFIGMTLYQRIYACRSVSDAKKAWYLAGILEYPFMAFSGVLLGMCARAALPQVTDAEMGLPLLIRDVLPVGIKGVVIAAYFSAIMSTADSCLMASSNALVNDVIQQYVKRPLSPTATVRLSQGATLVVGVAALVLASVSHNVLAAILHAYAFMVGGLFVPTLAALFWPRAGRVAALGAMAAGGLTTLAWTADLVPLPPALAGTGLDPIVFGLVLSALAMVVLTWAFPRTPAEAA